MYFCAALLMPDLSISCCENPEAEPLLRGIAYSLKLKSPWLRVPPTYSPIRSIWLAPLNAIMLALVPGAALAILGRFCDWEEWMFVEAWVVEYAWAMLGYCIGSV